MLAIATKNFDISTSPHSIGLQDDITIPSAWADNNWFVRNEKKFLVRGFQGLGCNCNKGLGDSNLADTVSNIFSDVSNLTQTDWIIVAGAAIGVYALGFLGKRRR